MPIQAQQQAASGQEANPRHGKSRNLRQPERNSASSFRDEEEWIARIRGLRGSFSVLRGGSEMRHAMSDVRRSERWKRSTMYCRYAKRWCGAPWDRVTVNLLSRRGVSSSQWWCFARVRGAQVKCSLEVEVLRSSQALNEAGRR